MRIGIFVELYHPRRSGVVVSVDTTVEQLIKQGHEVFIFTPKVPGYEDSTDVRVFRLPSYPFCGERFAFPLVPRRLVDHAKSLNIDLIHIQGPFATGVLGIKVAKKLGVPVVMTFHTHVLLYIKTWTKVWNLPFAAIMYPLALWAIRWTTSHSQLIFAPSNYIANVLARSGIKTTIEILPTAVEPQEKLPTRSEARKILGLPNEGLIWLYVGRLAKEKNLKMLIEAAKQVFAENTKVTLLLVGDGPFRVHLERIVEKQGLQDRIIFVGSVPHDRVWTYLVACDVFGFPSVSETQGLAVFEAMSLAISGVVVNEGGACELVENGKTGLVVSNDAQEFARATLRLLNDPEERYFLGMAARMKTAGFTPEGACQKMVASYRRLIGKSAESLEVL